MYRGYYDDLVDVAIKHAGHDILKEASMTMDAGEARFSDDFEKRMQKIIGAENRKERRSKALRAAARIAAALLVLVVISTAVIFSSEALRTEVMNMFSSIGRDSADVEFYEVGENDIPAGMIVPRYLPAGYKLVEAEKNGEFFTSRYEDSSGNMLRIMQQSQNTSAIVDSDGKDAYETEIKGEKAFVSENEEGNLIIFNYRSYVFSVLGKTDVSELKKVAESIME
ncbi:MAG: DUF4367 domain-containing protein [Burkholderiales bacterium]